MKKPILKNRLDLMLLIIFIICLVFIILDFVILSFGATFTIKGLLIFFIKTVIASLIFDYFFEA